MTRPPRVHSSSCATRPRRPCGTSSRRPSRTPTTPPRGRVPNRRSPCSTRPSWTPSALKPSERNRCARIWTRSRPWIPPSPCHVGSARPCAVASAVPWTSTWTPIPVIRSATWCSWGSQDWAYRTRSTTARTSTKRSVRSMWPTWRRCFRSRASITPQSRLKPCWTSRRALLPTTGTRSPCVT